MKPASADRRRQGVVAATALVGTALLRQGLVSRPGSRRFYALTLGAAATWAVGGLASGPVPWTSTSGRPGPTARSVAGAVATGAAAFGAFYGAALVARRVPALEPAVADVLRYSQRGSDPLVLLTTLANAVGEEIFFRGAVYAAAETAHPVAVTTGVYALATASTGNRALVLAALAMGTLLATQRRASDGVQAPLLTHLTWSALMLRFLPPLFPPRAKLP